MNTIKIKCRTKKSTESFDIEIDKIIYILSRLENNSKLKYKNQKQVEFLLEKYNLFDEYFLKNVNMI